MRVSTYEEHSSVLPEWWRRQVRGRTLIYLDAHLDLQYVNQNHLSDLERCTTVEEVKRLEKPHHLLPDQHFSYSLENFLYPAHRLGMIERVIWVAPPHVETGIPEETFTQLQQVDGILFEELASFTRGRGGWIEGRLLGLDITICRYGQLELLPLPADSLVDIDIDYFVTVPGDKAWINPRSIFQALDQLPLKPEFITLSRSVNSGFMPLRYRFFADYLAALWERRQHDAAHFERLFGLDCRLQAGEGDGFVNDCLRELENYPECAATNYLLSLAEQDPGRSKRFQGKAAELCSSYRPNALRSVCEIANRQLPVTDSTMLALAKRVAEARDGSQEQVLGHVALGLIYCAGGQVSPAVAHYQRCAEQLGSHPELALEIGKLYLDSQHAELALPLLDAALQDDKTRAAAHVLLSHLHEQKGSREQALEHLEAAHRLTPAWGQILTKLAELHQQLGHQQRSEALLAQYQHQQLETARLAKQLTDTKDAPIGTGVPRRTDGV